MTVNFERIRDHLKQFEFGRLFIEQLGWSHPPSNRPTTFPIEDAAFTSKQIAELGGVIAFEVSSENGVIPNAEMRAKVHREIAKLHHENLLIFVDSERIQSLWYWVKRQDGRMLRREHHYMQGQPGDLFLSKLAQIVCDIGDLDEQGEITIVEVLERLRAGLDIEHVTKKFYGEFYQQHLAFVELIQGIADDHDRRWYASILMNRLMFIYFLQEKRFLNDGELKYLQNRLTESQERGRDLYFKDFLDLLFFEGFAKPKEQRSAEARERLGSIKYLNGGLFLRHRIEEENPNLNVPDKAFENLFSLFDRYSWNLNDTPGGKDDEINPDVLGYIFEKYINQKAFGAYYTRLEITEYLCEHTIHRLILNEVNTPESVKATPIPGIKFRSYENIGEMLMDLDAALCKRLLLDILPKLSLLDPACGSGAFLVAAMKTLINLYSAVIGKIKFLNAPELSQWLAKAECEHASIAYFIKKRIITDNLYGVDIMEEATEIAKLRLFLALVASAETEAQLEPLPNIDFNILTGNSLIGLMRVDDKDFENRTDNLFRRSYREILAEKNRLIETYRNASTYAEDLTSLRDNIEGKKSEAIETLNDILLGEFSLLKIKFEQATWDVEKNGAGKPEKRPLNIEDINSLRAFHWGFEFDEIIQSRGGFDAIITNPPWEVFQTDEKEFFQEYVPTIKKKKLRIEDWKKQFKELMKDEELRIAWLSYASSFPHLSVFYKTADQYKNQRSYTPEGSRIASKINLYKLFTEQCTNLLRPGGQCGIVIPSGIYTDLGAKQLREMLFNETQMTGMFGIENRKAVFEGVDSRFKFVVLTFEKGGSTKSFPAAFMRHDVAELERFPQQGSIDIDVDLVRRLSPGSLSVMEFKSELDVQIAKKMLRFPLLGERIDGKWHIILTQEFNLTSSSDYFETSPASGRLPLFTGKMFWQFETTSEHSGYWIPEDAGRSFLLGKCEDRGQRIDYQGYRWVHRRIASNTNERTLVATIAPKRVFTEVNSTTLKVVDTGITNTEMIFLCCISNSFALDWMVRQKVTTTLNMFYIYQLPVPRLTESDPAFGPIVERAAKLICTSPEFDDLAKEVGLGSHKNGVADPDQRARLRAELDGMIAHLYGLTEEEFTHVLSAFPIVADSVKSAALTAYHELTPKAADDELSAIISRGESSTVEFKSTARWDMRERRLNKGLEQVIVKTVAAFLNSDGGTLLIGVDDDGNVLGLADDYKTLGKKPDRDGYELWLNKKLLDQFGKDCARFISITFGVIEGKDVCRVEVNRAPRACYVTNGSSEDLYIRTGNATQALSISEAIAYCRHHWDEAMGG